MKQNSQIIRVHNEIHLKNTTPIDQYLKATDKLLTINEHNPISLFQLEFNHLENTDSLLNGVPYSLKDNIATKGIKTTGGSRFLEEYVPQYNSTVKNLLDDAGAVCISKDNLDEFGLGGSGIFSAYGIVKHPLDNLRIAGGSSSGSSVMVAKKIVAFAIATDTGDSIRRPASLQGIVGFKPTYGSISRYGIYPYAPSMDHVGILANDVQDVAIVMNYLAKQDPLDMTSIKTKHDFLKGFKPLTNFKLVFIKEALDHMAAGEKEVFKKYLSQLQTEGIKITYKSFGQELLSLIDPVYKTITYAEAATSWANLTGILFGNSLDGNNFDELITRNRTNFLGRQLKRRFVIGAYVTSQKNYHDVFVKAKKVRRLIVDQAQAWLAKYDAILLPGASSIAPLIQDEINQKSTTTICDDALQIANFGGFPSITIPAIAYNNLFVGLNITGKLNDDLKVLNIAKTLSEVHDA